MFVNIKRLSPEQTITVGLIAAIIVLVGVLFHFHGNTTETIIYGRSLFRQLFHKWNDPMGSMSHGWLIPLIALYCVWDRRTALVAAEKRVWWGGLVFVVGALALHWAGLRVQQSRLSMFGLIGLIWSVPALIYGPTVGRKLIFPCGYLLLAVPWHFLDTMTFPLRMMATMASGWVLNGLGIVTTRVGTAMYSTAGGGFAVDVADPCSGLRSLLAIVALSTAYAYLSHRTNLHRWIICLLSVPLVLVANMCRIVITAMLFMVVKGESAKQFIHDCSGYLVFILAVVLLMGLDALLLRIGTWRPREWKKRAIKHS